MAARPLVLVLAACALAGCGEEGPSDEQQIRATLTAFGNATADRDYAALCERILAPELIETIARIGLPCEVALERGFEDVREPRLAVGTVTVDGDEATAQVRSSAQGQAASEDSVELVRVGEGWRIASLTGP